MRSNAATAWRTGPGAREGNCRRRRRPSFQNRPLLLLLDPLSRAYRTGPWSYLCGSPLRFDADAAVFAFGTTYEAEMTKLPQEASEMSREAKHRELLGLNEGDRRQNGEASEDREVDVLALLSDARRPTPEASL